MKTLTLTLSGDQLYAVKRALKDRIKAIYLSDSLIDTDFADHEAHRKHWHLFYQVAMDCTRQVLEQVEIQS